MIYKIKFSDIAVKQLEKLDKISRRRILRYIKETISHLDNPRMLGKLLKGNLGGLWRYRVGDYRIICKIQDDKFLVCVVQIGHRRSVYER